VYPEASQALLTLAETQQLTEPAWEAMAMALGGTETVLRTVIPLQPAQNKAPGAAVSEPGSVVQILQEQQPQVLQAQARPASLAYLDYNSKAPQTWSDTEINRRLVLIDQLLGTDPEPEAVAALQKARQSILAWRQAAVVDGKRKKL